MEQVLRQLTRWLMLGYIHGLYAMIRDIIGIFSSEQLPCQRLHTPIS